LYVKDVTQHRTQLLFWNSGNSYKQKALSCIFSSPISPDCALTNFTQLADFIPPPPQIKSW
jgi:hypothetical protein